LRLNHQPITIFLLNKSTGLFPSKDGKNILFNGPKISNPADTLTITITSPDSAYTVYNPTDNQQTTRVYNAYLSMLVQNVG
jgi:flagellar basal body L-ring protein FlgH